MSSQYEWIIPYNINRLDFERAVEDCHRVCNFLAEPPTSMKLGGWDGTGEPLFRPGVVSFNGHRLDSAQTFQIRLDGTGPLSCNTQSLDYDLAVRCCLIIFEQRVKGFTYKGGPGEPSWLFAAELTKRALL